MSNEHTQAHASEHTGFPWKHVIGLVLSLILTFAALWCVTSFAFSPALIVTVIVILAVVQAFVQLFMFMHITEGSKVWQITAIGFGAFIAFCVVAGTLWIMLFAL
ncbi:cytochrome aa3-600 menaquinol oxidase subunit 4 [Scopulibacillus daqui]|uniref:Quinol oxidase subunit 4 n=1 Tax=Scopulibacillus daqui TaxID=1469162 RepID=A0ABS2Q307_9BACL|nr:cytochrome aa3 quinol oxidase subunit IV [Scopulibacillus daqui]MBM7646679.1 cytochrome aa3-600 menaquinol oxidase subunit 4 [Scopulibacillus daqui]